MSRANRQLVQIAALGLILLFTLYGAIITMLAADLPSGPEAIGGTVLLVAGVGGMAIAVRVFVRRRVPGRCRTCGYDLRASKDKCPECGTAVHGG